MFPLFDFKYPFASVRVLLLDIVQKWSIKYLGTNNKQITLIWPFVIRGSSKSYKLHDQTTKIAVKGKLFRNTLCPFTNSIQNLAMSVGLITLNYYFNQKQTLQFILIYWMNLELFKFQFQIIQKLLINSCINDSVRAYIRKHNYRFRCF